MPENLGISDGGCRGENEVAAVNGNPGGLSRHEMCSAMRVNNLVRKELPPESPQGAQMVVYKVWLERQKKMLPTGAGIFNGKLYAAVGACESYP